MSPPVAAPSAGLSASYWWLWTASTLSNLADGVLKIALPLAAVRVTDQPLLVAGVALALTLPWLLVALPAGAIADRVDRRRAMLAANAVRVLAVTVLSLTWLGGLDSLALLYVVALVVGVTETFYDTASQSILPQVVGRGALDRANGRLYAAELTANQFVGPPLGGLLVAAGLWVALGAPALLWIAAIGALALVRGTFRVERAVRTTLRADIGEGLRFLVGNPVLRTLAVMVGVLNLGSSAVFAVFVLYAVGPGSPLGLTEPGYGLLLTAGAVGAVVGSLAAPWVARVLGRSGSLLLCIAVGAVALGAPAVTTDVVLVGGLFALNGLTIAVWNVVTVSLRQRITPDALLGRLNSAYRLLAWGTMPIGAALGGLVAQVAGLDLVFLLAAGLSLTLLPLLGQVTNARIAAAEATA
ncbi:MFS transporter [Nocardioides alkalitolerans]|uniref:MFS transporter n=1 Tax=Nocardioides alkalitolerans TaxID=281714 RepID=UPI0003FC8232|nr:MFS transporter [Nocardioides alkalitolerans]